MRQFCLNDINLSVPLEESQIIHTGLHSVEALNILRCIFAYEAGFGIPIGGDFGFGEGSAFENGLLTSYSTWKSEKNYAFDKSIWSGIGVVTRGENGEVVLTVKSYLWFKQQRHDTVYKIFDNANKSIYVSLRRLKKNLDNYFDQGQDIVKLKTRSHLRFIPGCYNAEQDNSYEQYDKYIIKTFKISRKSVEELMLYFKAKAEGKTYATNLIGTPFDAFANTVFMDKKEAQTKLALKYIDQYDKLKQLHYKETQRLWDEAEIDSVEDWENASKKPAFFNEVHKKTKRLFVQKWEAELAAIVPEEI